MPPWAPVAPVTLSLGETRTEVFALWFFLDLGWIVGRILRDFDPERSKRFTKIAHESPLDGRLRRPGISVHAPRRCDGTLACLSLQKKIIFLLKHPISKGSKCTQTKTNATPKLILKLDVRVHAVAAASEGKL